MFIKTLIFSGGSYQGEISNGEEYWAFIKISDDGSLIDSFCGCKSTRCAHVEFLLNRVTSSGVALHLLFLRSPWYFAMEIIFSKGISLSNLKKDGKKYFSDYIEIHIDKDSANTELSLLMQEDNDNDSINWKFSTINAPSPYDLSSWSSLAKWIFLEEDPSKRRAMLLEDRMVLSGSWKDLSVEVFIPIGDIPRILSADHSSTKGINISPFNMVILESATYNIKNISFDISMKRISTLPTYSWEQWLYIDGVFFGSDRLLDKDVSRDIEKCLDNDHFRSRLTTPIGKPISPKYHIKITNNHIGLEAYFDEGKSFQRFGKWIFINGVFHKISDDAILESVDLNNIISKGSKWIKLYLGLDLFDQPLAQKMGWVMESDGLRFFKRENDSHHDLGSHIFVEGLGFYPNIPFNGNKLSFDRFVPRSEISRFLEDNEDTLEGVINFFGDALNYPISNSYIDISLVENGILIVATYDSSRKISIYGNFVYSREFYKIADNHKLPDQYYPQYITEDIDHFLKKELPYLRSCFQVKLDNRLREPERLSLKLISVKSHRGLLYMQMVYSSEIGVVDVELVKQGVLGFAKKIFTDAGILSLESMHWWKDIDIVDGSLVITPIEWEKIKTLSPNLILPDDFEVQLEPSTINTKKLQGWLHDYQMVGVRWLLRLYYHGLGGLLCDDMGLGKTHQTMALISTISDVSDIKVLVITPPSVIHHWARLLDKYLNVKLIIHHGATRNKNKITADIVLTTYGTLKQDEKIFLDDHFDLMVMDEIHISKNPKSKLHRVLKKMPGKIKIGLTGTPIENSLEDLKALFELILPGYLTTLEKYGGRESLLEGARHFILRRKKVDILDELPEKREETLFVDLSAEQTKISMEARELSRNSLKGEHFYMHAFTLINRMKQICDHPAVFNGDLDNFHKYSSSKWDLFKGLLEDARNSQQKVVVFSQYLNMLYIMEKHLLEQGVEYALIKGDTKNRSREVSRFQEDDKCEVFLGSLHAAGVGIDLTSASIVIHYDRWWNPAKEDQATDRVYRLGQNKGVMVYKLVCKDSVEESIDAILERKRVLMDDLLVVDAPEKMLTSEELESLLSKIYENS